eukprot:comp17943_c0_seq2/m.18251 comp17943_c0_seq2/g.18251  ORF comp17943_c0_seq2/g.18251 comp17943_c0_seq2/m.18251 type:complete len:372 (-) comp17943_c0_seq2:39-1154(-)
MSASQDANLRILEADRNYRLRGQRRCRHIQWSVIDCDYSPDKEHVAYSSWSPFVHLTNVVGVEDKHTPLDFRPESAYHFCLFSIKFSSDGSYLLGGSNESAIYIYDLNGQQRTTRIVGHDDDINSVAFAKDSLHIFYSASDDGLCKVWDTRAFQSGRSQPVGVLRGHTQGLTHVASKSDGRYLVTNSKDQTAKLWDIRAMSSDNGNGPGTSFDYRMSALPRGRRFDPHDKSIMTYMGHRVMRTLIRARFSPSANTGERFIYTGDAEGRVFVYDVLTGDTVSVLRGHDHIVRDVSWHPVDNVIVSSSWDRTLMVWEYREDGSRDTNPITVKNLAPPRTATSRLWMEEDTEEEEEDEDYEEEEEESEEGEDMT